MPLWTTLCSRMTVPHEIRVAREVGLIGRALGLGEFHIDSIRLAALVHDIGKRFIPTRILEKPGQLTTDEYSVVKAHSVIGEQVVIDLGLPVQSDWVRHHHERWDGRGYPDGLKGGAIPLESSIIAVADVLDALTSPRPYRDALSLEDAIVEIRENSGSQFDPQCVEALIISQEGL